MWNRDRSSRNALDKLLVDAPAPPAATPTIPAPVAEPTAEPARPTASTKPTVLPAPTPAVKTSVLGPTLKFKGDLVADEDLVVQGHIQGSILHSRSLTIGQDGSMTGDIRARRVVVEGSVAGNLYALDSVSIRATAEVAGSIYAPRVAVSDGAVFNGTIDMQHAPAVPQALAPEVVPDVEISSTQVDHVLTAGTGTDF
jgi:cytoskeletal protein CcmA (bactofilin family)